MLETLLAGAAIAHCSVEEAETAIRANHAAFIEAHLTNDLDLWKSLEMPERWDGNNGEVKRVGDARWAGIESYLNSVRFTRYEDEAEPVVRVAEDCSMGWAMVQVRVEGHAISDAAQSFASTFAWVELYRNSETGWKMEATLSNRAPSE